MVRLVKEGFIKEINVMGEFLRDNLDDITFQEAYDKTGRILNITVTGYKTHEQDRLLNYLTSPNVVIWSAVCVSCSVPFIFGPFDLLCKDHRGHIVKYVEGTTVTQFSLIIYS
jgi:predicted acylesterase/phospholipase RssA